MEKEADASLPLFPYKRLSLWESWRGAPERARMLTKNWERDDSIALTKGLLIAVQRLYRKWLALSVTFGDTARVAAPSVCFAVACILLAAAPTAPPCFRRWRRSSPLLPEGEALAGRAALSWTLEAQYGAKGRALLQRAAASGQRTLSSCRWPGQQGTTVHETDKLCSSRGNLTDMPRPPLGRGGGTASAVTERFSLSRNLPAFSSTLPYPSDTPDASNASGRAGRTRSGQSGRRGAAPRPYLPASG